MWAKIVDFAGMLPIVNGSLRTLKRKIAPCMAGGDFVKCLFSDKTVPRTTIFSGQLA